MLSFIVIFELNMC